MINTKVYFFKNGCTFELRRGDFVVPRAERTTELICFFLVIPHECVNSFRDGCEIVILELLSFCWSMTEHGSAAKYEVGAGIMQSFINYKIFLLPAKCSGDSCDVLIKIITNVHCRFVHRLKSF